jgi:hypothetical protein
MNWVARPESAKGVVSTLPNTPVEDSGRATHSTNNLKLTNTGGWTQRRTRLLEAEARWHGCYP